MRRLAVEHGAQSGRGRLATERPDVRDALVQLSEQADGDLLRRLRPMLPDLQQEAVEQRRDQQLQAFVHHDLGLHKAQVGTSRFDQTALGNVVLADDDVQIRLDPTGARHKRQVHRVAVSAGNDAYRVLDPRAVQAVDRVVAVLQMRLVTQAVIRVDGRPGRTAVLERTRNGLTETAKPQNQPKALRNLRRHRTGAARHARQPLLHPEHGRSRQRHLQVQREALERIDDADVGETVEIGRGQRAMHAGNDRQLGCQRGGADGDRLHRLVVADEHDQGLAARMRHAGIPERFGPARVGAQRERRLLVVVDISLRRTLRP